MKKYLKLIFVISFFSGLIYYVSYDPGMTEAEFLDHQRYVDSVTANNDSLAIDTLK